MILNGNDKVGEARVYETVLEMKQSKEIQSLKEKLSQYESQNKKLRECLKLYSDEKRWRKQTKTTWTICPRDDVEYKNSHHYGVGGKRARECLKGIDSE